MERRRSLSRKFVYTLLIVSMLVLMLKFSAQPVKADASIEVLQNHSGYINELGFYYIVGEVENVGDTPVWEVRVNATFYDVNGTFVANGSGTTTLDVLLSGRKSPFEITLYSGQYSILVHNYTLSATFSPAWDKPMGLKILSNSSSTSSDGYLVTGEIANVGNENSSYNKVIATFYNESNFVIATKFNYSDPYKLVPSQIAPFEILLNSLLAANVTHYVLEAESMQYTMVPEFHPIALLSTLLVSSLAICLMIRRYNFGKRSIG